ncbi:MAG: GAF domain-containing protein [Gemmatimonadetes bacterium]|nr:GAF domain-containing protein [Gemmatimonadota bacterium]
MESDLLDPFHVPEDPQPPRQDSADRHRFLLRAADLFASSLEFEDRIRNLARLAVPVLGDVCVVDLVEEDGSIRRVAAAHAHPEMEGAAQELLRFPPRPGASSGVGQALESGRAVLCNAVSEEMADAAAVDADHRAVIRRLGVRALLVVPLVARGHTLGAITVGACAPGRRYQDGDRELAEDLANRAALALDNARLYRQACRALRAREEVLAVVSHELRNPLDAARLLITEVLRRSHPQDEPPRDRQRFETLDRLNHQVARLVEDLLDGSIRAESEPGRGATFSFPLPVGEGEAGEPADPHAGGEVLRLPPSSPAPHPPSASRTDADRAGAQARRARLLREMQRVRVSGAEGRDAEDLLHEVVASAVHLGRLQAMDRLPSIRAAATALGLEKHAMVRAYDALEAAELVEKRERSGVFVRALQGVRDEPLGETAHWLAEVLSQACDHQIRIPYLPDLVRRSTSATRLRCACVESDADSRIELCRETAHQFGLDSADVSPDALPARPGAPDAELAAAVRDADVLITTAFHAHVVRPVARRLGKPLVVARLQPERVRAIEEHLRSHPLSVVCTDPAYGERMRRMFGGARPDRVRVVDAADADALAALDPAVPVLMTRAARGRPGTENLRLVVPSSPVFSPDFARTLSSLIIRLNVELGRVGGRSRVSG